MTTETTSSVHNVVRIEQLRRKFVGQSCSDFETIETVYHDSDGGRMTFTAYLARDKPLEVIQHPLQIIGGKTETT